MTSETDGNGKTTTYQYDEGGRLISKLLPNGSSITFSYDQVDNISQVQLSGGESYKFTYDLEGRPTNVKVYSGANMTNEIKSTYDAIGNLIGYSDGNRGTVSNPVGLDQLNRITGFNLVYNGGTTSVISAPYAFTYTGNGLPSTVSVDGKNFAMIYDDGDKLINRNTPDKTQDIYSYNDANQVTRVQTVKVDPNGTTLIPQWSSQYTFDTDGRISTVNGTRPSGANLSESYTYNSGTEKLNRLTKAVIDGTTFNYQYDPAGNITSMSLPYFGTKTFTYDADNRITNSGFGYDNNGNLTSVAMYGTNYKYSYDSANRLTTVKDAGNNLIVSYTYDGDGNRLTKTVADGTKTNYHYFQGQLMYETAGTTPENTTVKAVYLRSADGTLLGVKLNGSYYYYHYDGQGNVVAVTDSNGAVYRQYVYDPYGNIMSVKDGSGAAVNISSDPGFNHAYTYRGYRFDSETGLYFLNSRYYAAGIGRFLTKDTFKGDPKIPSTLNLYTYCGGDPVNRIDLTGRDWVDYVKAGATGAAYGAIDAFSIILFGPAGADVVVSRWSARLAAKGAGSVGSLGAAKRLIYEASPKHGSIAKGSISAAPRNGQEALDLSVQVKSTSPRRIGIDYGTGEFNVFDQTSAGVFHGHVRSWNELTSEMQKTLRQAGMVDSRGRILGGK